MTKKKTKKNVEKAIITFFEAFDAIASLALAIATFAGMMLTGGYIIEHNLSGAAWSIVIFCQFATMLMFGYRYFDGLPIKR